MAESYFIFKGLDSRSMGVISAGAAPIMRGEERVEHVTIPGRAGELTQTEGDGIFNGYIQTVTISVKGASHVREIMDWLSGEGFVTFSGEPDRQQKARVIGAVTLERVSRNIDHWAGQVQFYCEPLKRRLTEESAALTAPGNIYNDGDVAARPRITVTCAAGADVVITSSSGTFEVDLTGRTETGLVIDCDAEEVTSLDGNTLMTVYSAGDFPRLNPGTVAVGGSGWTRLDIEKRCRYL